MTGLGHFVPAEVVPNGVLAERLGVDDAWIVKRTGVKSRRRAAPSESLSDMATFAARRALADADVDPLDVDLILVATMTADEIIPNAAPLVAHALGAERAGAVDIGAACTGFLAALRLGAGQIETGRADRVLVIGAEALTRVARLRRSQDRAPVRRRRRRGAAGRRRRGRDRPDRAGRRRLARPQPAAAATRTARSAWTATRPTRPRSSA